ncbi:MAG: single-stranded DNA-binding protein [Terracidiphilus sp.]
MSKSLNRVTLLGHAGKDPEVHVLPSGTLVNLSLATSERFKDSRGEWQERTEWHHLVGHQRIGEILRDYVRKGSRIYVEGALRTRSWEDRESGQRRYRVEVVLTDINLLSPAIASNGAGESEHYASGNGSVPQEFSGEQEIEHEEVPY